MPLGVGVVVVVVVVFCFVFIVEEYFIVLFGNYFHKKRAVRFPRGL